MYKYYNPNPVGTYTDDCTVRALTLALGEDWDTTFFRMAINAAQMGVVQMDLDRVWGSVLRQHGFFRRAVNDRCPDCITVQEFAETHPHGVFVLAVDRHVVTVVDGDWYDTADSGDEIVKDYFYRRDG